MAISVTMPRLGESVSEGTVTRWLKQEGDRVEADEPLLEVSTDKVDTEIPSPAAGVLKAIKVGEDETVEVGSELAVIEDGSGGGGDDGAAQAEQAAEKVEEAEEGGDEQPAKAEESSPAEPEPEKEQEPSESAAATEEKEAVADDSADQQEQREKPAPQEDEAAAQADAPAQTDSEDDDADGRGPSYVTPLVRRLAAEHGVDLAQVNGTGVGGRIRKQDVLDAAKSGGAKAPAQRQSGGERPAAPAAKSATAPAKASAERAPQPAPDTSLRGRTEKLSRLRRVIAERMTESLQISAQLTTVLEADITRIARLRDRAKGDFEAREGVKLSYMPFFALAVCEALREHPAVNSSIDLEGGTVTYHDAVHLGIAVDTPRGLLVPVIKDASDLNLAGLARKIADLADRTRSNSITPDELGGGTFTLTNTGSRGALFDTPIINQPQVGILGTGAIVKRPVVVDDPDVGEVIAVRHMLYLALTYDHRMVDGADAARFVSSVKERLEEGEFEAELGL
ncbi:MAG TPA: 2-oxoglutarate dehydrogenase, E2 component, dihydrolipoamide succinyltransferase [Mycobacteriales bacterium]|nr:2-oxoglutarate dehydrogenase, E2 component, dihydrolipoamide succinyltransferase [Mycobacteriales bacterium]